MPFWARKRPPAKLSPGAGPDYSFGFRLKRDASLRNLSSNSYSVSLDMNWREIPSTSKCADSSSDNSEAKMTFSSP